MNLDINITLNDELVAIVITEIIVQAIPENIIGTLPYL